MYHNQEKFLPDKFGDEKILRVAQFTKIFSVTNKEAVWTEGFVTLSSVTDETDFFQVGQSEQDDFAQIEVGETAPSAFNVWPTKEKPVMYKFNSIYLEMSQ